MEYNAYIICAGLSTRFGYPKFLSKASDGGITVLEHNLNILKRYHKHIYVVLNEKLELEYRKTVYDICSDLFDVIEIESGKGDAHAIYNALKNTCMRGASMILWGDTILNEKAYKECMAMDFNASFGIVSAYEMDPYVVIKEYAGNVVDCYFNTESNSKKLLHDQSLFYIDNAVFLEMFEKYSDYINGVLMQITPFIKVRYEYSFIKMMKFIITYYTDIRIKTYVVHDINHTFNTKEEFMKISSFI